MAGRRKKTALPSQTREEKDAILAKAPPSATRFRVTDKNGSTRWRTADDVRDSDYLHAKEGSGKPFIMRGTPGPKKLEDKADQATIRSREDKIDKDPLVVIAQGSPESPEVINQVVRGLAREVAALELERHRLEGAGRGTIQAHGKKITALKALGEMCMRRQDQVASEMIDLDGPMFRELFKLIMETFQEAMMDARLRSEHIEAVFAKVADKVDGTAWPSEARRRMKGLKQ